MKMVVTVARIATAVKAAVTHVASRLIATMIPPLTLVILCTLLPRLRICQVFVISRSLRTCWESCNRCYKILYSQTSREAPANPAPHKNSRRLTGNDTIRNDDHVVCHQSEVIVSSHRVLGRRHIRNNCLHSGNRARQSHEPDRLSWPGNPNNQSRAAGPP